MGLLLVILAAWIGFRRARQTGRSGVLWATVAVIAFLGTQFICGLSIGLLLAVGIAVLDWPETVFDHYASVIGIIAFVVSLGALLLVFRFLDKTTPVENFTSPPPPSFDNGERFD